MRYIFAVDRTNSYLLFVIVRDSIAKLRLANIDKTIK